MTEERARKVWTSALVEFSNTLSNIRVATTHATFPSARAKAMSRSKRTLIRVTAASAALILSCLIAVAEGAFQSGDNLLALCLGKEVGICLGYVEAVADAMSEKSLGKPTRICVPGDVTGQRILHVVISFLLANPSMRHSSASPMVAAALAETFPCPL
jgi:hypothetical protein